MEEKKIICIICPIGCNITVRGEAGIIESMEGYTCKRGEEYAQNEFTHPVRILTSTIKVESGNTPLVPIRSNKPVPKELIFDCMKLIRNHRIAAPVHSHDVLIPDIMGTGIDIIATGSVEQEGLCQNR
jgi:Uncharacterized protein with conserved CXXC pairs